MILKRQRFRLVPIVMVPVCFAASLCSYKIARADLLARQDTPESLRQAVAIFPDRPDYLVRLSQLAPDEQRVLLERAVGLSHYDAKARIELALLDESDGNLASAEGLLLQASSIDRTWLPRWSLVNYYFRRGQQKDFWIWARRAAERPTADLVPLFRLCSRVSTDAGRISREILPDHADTLGQFMWSLLSQDQLEAASAVVPRMMQCAPAEYRSIVFALIDRLLKRGRPAEAAALWSLLQAKGWITPDANSPYNGGFNRPFLETGFDWKPLKVDGILSTRSSRGFEIELSGSQPETCNLIEQLVWAPRGITALQYRFQAGSIPSSSGLRWRILNTAGEVLDSSSDLGQAMEGIQERRLKTPLPPGLFRLQFAYRRTTGTTRLTGVVLLQQVSVQPNAAIPSTHS